MVKYRKEGYSPPFSRCVVSCLLLFTIPFLIYLNGLPGGFVLDDSVNIIYNDAIKIDSLNYESLKSAALSSGAGPIKRPIPMLSFAINYYFWGENVTPYKITNIVIHSLNAVLVFIFTVLVLDKSDIRGSKEKIAFLIALFWAIAPINLTSVLYVVQRMVSLGALFALAALVCWMLARNRLESSRHIPVMLVVCFLITFIFSVLCKENYILVGLAVFIIEWLLYQRSRSLEVGLWKLQKFMMAIVPLALILILIVSPEILLGSYEHRPFSLTERLLTQSRAVVFYIGQIILPSNIYLGLYHDDFQISKSLTQPFSTIISILILSGLFLAGCLFRVKNVLFSFGVFWFFGWHLVESTALPLELVYEHRNYLASLGLILAAYAVLSVWIKKLKSKLIPKVVILTLFLVSAGVLWLRAGEWNDRIEHAIAEASHHPESVRAKYQLGRLYLMLYQENKNSELLLKSKEALIEAQKLSHYDLLPDFGLIRINILAGKPIDEDATRLIAKLRNQKIPNSTVAALDILLKCIKDKECDPAIPYYLDMLNAVSDNPSTRKRVDAALVSMRANFYSYVKNDPENVERILKLGLETEPMNYEMRKSLLYFYVVRQKYGKAEKELAGFYKDFQGKVKAIAISKEICGILIAKGVNSNCVTRVGKLDE